MIRQRKTILSRIILSIILIQNQENKRHLHPADIKNIIQNQGKATIRGQEYQLIQPQPNDQNLQTIIKNPNFIVKPTGETPQKGEKTTYEVSSPNAPQKVKITITCN